MSPIVRLSFLIVVDSVSGNAITILIKFHTAVCHVWKEKKIYTYMYIFNVAMNIYVHKDQKCAMNIKNFRVSTEQWKNHRENYKRFTF